jgi:hypothetical protein
MKKKWILWLIPVIVVGLIVWLWWKDRKTKAAKKSITDNKIPAPVATANPGIIWKQMSFAKDSKLTLGAIGDDVKAFQNALIEIYGKDILPQFGADGMYGNETLSALKKAGVPETFTEKELYDILDKLQYNDYNDVH